MLCMVWRRRYGPDSLSLPLFRPAPLVTNADARWDAFVWRVREFLDASRRGQIVRIDMPGGVALLNQRHRPGPDVKLTIPSSDLRLERRRVRDVLNEGGAVAITRWGVVDGVLWTVRAEEAWLMARDQEKTT